MIYIITVCWNNAADTIKLIESLDLVEEPFTLIISDNKSNHDNQFLLDNFTSHFNKFRIITLKNEKNGGYAYGINCALQIALLDNNAKLFWILNNDITVTKGSLTALVSKISENNNDGICGSTLIYEHDKKTIQAIGGKYNSWIGTSSHILGGVEYCYQLCKRYQNSRIDYIVGASMLVSRHFIETVGLMDEQYFLYSEETDWAIRGARLGFSLAYAPDSILYHKEGATTQSSMHIKKSDRSDPADKLHLRSQLILSMKFYPFRHIIVRIFFLARLAKRLANGNFKGALNVINAAMTVWQVKTSVPEIKNDR